LLVGQDELNGKSDKSLREQLIEACNDFIKTFPERAEYTAQLGKALAECEIWAESIKCYGQSLKVVPSNSQVQKAYQNGSVLK
jgi:hypothetical protein